MSDTRDEAERRRPSPKALMELATRQGRGKLKVFLGAAPGVGKTYAMLAAARVPQAEGVDVLVGVVETHGRTETAALLDGLEILPRRPVSYRTRTLLEFDLDAALARHPTLLLVDEFAHSNVEGSLHPKRYQDVEDVLQAGINVWTTLNVQHLESLTDVVERITGVVVRETVPDKVLERADEIVVVDLPPEELIQRLHDGKVYLPENARLAIDRFFKPGNLTALRELALRRTADRVDEQMLAHLRQNAIEGAWPTAERLLVCVGRDELSEKVVRTAARMATALKSPWTALHLQPLAETVDRTTRRRSEKALRLAERLGADPARVAGRDMVAEILRFARQNNITQIVIGRAGVSHLKRWLGRSLADALVVAAKDIAVTVITPSATKAAGWNFQLPRLSSQAMTLATSAIAVTGATMLASLISRVTPLPNVAMIFLLAVLLCAFRFGVAPAISAALLSSLTYNFFFIEPFYSFAIAEPHEFVALAVFLAVAIVTGSMAGRLKQQSEAIRERVEETQALYEFSRVLSGAVKLDDILWALATHAARTVRGNSMVLLSEGGELTIRTAWPPDDALPTPDWAAARWAFKERLPAGRFTSTMPNAKFHFRLIGSADKPIGILGIEPDRSLDSMPSTADAVLQALSDQTAIAIERVQLANQATAAQAAVETERLRASLLSSISHDLRTPLASIVGSVTSLRALGERMSKSDRTDLLATIEEEAQRLSRFVANLLDMTRIEAGALDVRRDWVDFTDTVQSAVERARKLPPRRRIDLHVAPGLPLIRGDASLLEQVLLNLIDNADKFAEPGTPTAVDLSRENSRMILSVTDQRRGIPSAEIANVFEKFYRVDRGDGRPPGTGLGLSICRGIVTAMGGLIVAQSPAASGRGTRVTVSLPIPEAINPGEPEKTGPS